MKLDFSTDDAITPRAVELGYPRLLEDGEIRRARRLPAHGHPEPILDDGALA